MSWFRENSDRTWLQKQAAAVLKNGIIPKHVALIMDGNRRYARKNSIERDQGHVKGFEKLAETLEWCLDLGITEVTVYAFSIENFKRSKEEVNALMELAREKFQRLLQEKDMIEKHKVCVRVLGNIELLPLDIQKIIAEVHSITKHYTAATLNVCFAYTSRDEMCAAMREIAEGVQLGLILESDINENLLSQCLYTNKSADPDLLIRTSGEHRFSDFLLWQSTFSVLSFMQVLWPDFNIWHLFAGILHYQNNCKAAKEAKLYNDMDSERAEKESDLQCVMDSIADSEDSGDLSLKTRIDQYSTERKVRIEKFLQRLENKRENFLLSLLER